MKNKLFKEADKTSFIQMTCFMWTYTVCHLAWIFPMISIIPHANYLPFAKQRKFLKSVWSIKHIDDRVSFIKASKWNQISLGRRKVMWQECGWIGAQIGPLVYKMENYEFTQGTNLFENSIYQTFCPPYNSMDMLFSGYKPFSSGLKGSKMDKTTSWTGLFRIPDVVKTWACNNLNDMQYEQS